MEGAGEVQQEGNPKQLPALPTPPPHCYSLQHCQKREPRKASLGVAGEGGTFLKQPIWFLWGLAGSCVWGLDEQISLLFPWHQSQGRARWSCFGQDG